MIIKNEKGRAEAQEGEHDDLVMGLAIAYRIIEQVVFMEDEIIIQNDTQLQFQSENEDYSDDYGEDILLIILTIQISNIFMFAFFMCIFNNKKIVNPVKAYQEHKRQEEDDRENRLKEKQILESLENIDRFDGTSLGQKDISTE